MHFIAINKYYFFILLKFYIIKSTFIIKNNVKFKYLYIFMIYINIYEIFKNFLFFILIIISNIYDKYYLQLHNEFILNRIFAIFLLFNWKKYIRWFEYVA